MPEPETNLALRQALTELQRYLSDQVAPLMVADSIEVLVSYPPRPAAAAIEAWVAAQFRGARDGVGVSDYLFHALKKLHAMAHLNLIDRQRLTAYLDALGRILMDVCPAEDRGSFAQLLKGLGEIEAEPAAAVQVEHLRGGAGGGAAGPRAVAPVPAGALGEEVARGLKRLTLMAERLERAPTGGGKASAAGQQADLITQILATAALSSRSRADLEQYMQRLGQMGIESKTAQMFRALGRILPGWSLPSPEGGGAEPSLASSRAAEAMRRLVTLAEDPREGIERFTEMVQAAGEQFNEGQLAKAAAMFEVAERLIADKRVDADSAKLVRARGHESLSTDQLRAFAEKREKHARLRRVLGFFPALSVAGLMSDLDGEEKRDHRKLLLALLETHGAAAREAAFERLEVCVAGGGGDPNGYFVRNLVFLLRRIARAADADPEKEVALLASLSGWSGPLIVIKEALGALAQIRSGHAEAALIARLEEYEALLLQDGFPADDAGEVKLLLDRTTAALARQGTPNAVRAVVNHALSRKPALGDTTARLAELASQDLSADKQLIDHLVAALRSELPKKVLGFIVQKKSGHVLHLVQAISGTPTAAVRGVLEEIVERYPDQEFAKAASKALSGFAAPQRPAEAPAMSLSGDLDLFGMPTLFQTVADGRLSGLLTLLDRGGSTIATALFDGGKVRECRTGALSGETAFYQLFERPLDGTFHFKSRRAGAAGRAGGDETGVELIDVLPAMLEAMRRYDEFQQARAVVPDDVSLGPTGVKPTGPPDGEDTDFLHAVWNQAAAGATPTACEAVVAADSYRIRRLYAHWMEQGSLQAKQPAAARPGAARGVRS